MDIRGLLDRLDASMLSVNEVRRYLYARMSLSMFCFALPLFPSFLASRS